VGDRWVINASPVILLAKAEVIQFLPALCDELVVPFGVVDEVQNSMASDAGNRWLRNEGSKFVRKSGTLHPLLASWRGGVGEGEVISWALQNPGFTAILDDQRARSFATRNGIAVLGSLRVVVLAKEKGFIAVAKPALEKLRAEGAWVNEDLIRKAIELAGES
jgi:predicted nucleic acid-binding protein